MFLDFVKRFKPHDEHETKTKEAFPSKNSPNWPTELFHIVQLIQFIHTHTLTHTLTHREVVNHKALSLFQLQLTSVQKVSPTFTDREDCSHKKHNFQGRHSLLRWSRPHTKSWFEENQRKQKNIRLQRIFSATNRNWSKAWSQQDALPNWKQAEKGKWGNLWTASSPPLSLWGYKTPPATF